MYRPLVFLLLASSSLLSAWGQKEAVAAEPRPLVERYASLLARPKSYPCLKRTGEIVIDGRLDEPDWQRAPHTEPFEDIEGGNKPKPKFATTAQMLWDEDYFYVAATLEEPDVVGRLQMRDTIIWKENDFEVFIDPDGDGIDYYEFEVNARNTMMDLMMTHPYRSGGSFIMPWDCPGLRHAVHVEGTLNCSSDTDRGWTVEMAIPVRALRKNFGYTQGLTEGEGHWRVNFSRVQWLRAGGPEENWVWSPTGRIDIHMPERWAYVSFERDLDDCTGGIISPDDNLAWAMFYAQKDYHAAHGRFAATLEQLGLTDADRATLGEGGRIEMEAVSSKFEIRITPTEGRITTLDERGHLQHIDKSKP